LTNQPAEDLITALQNLIIPRYDGFWRLSGDWVICGDVHVPFTDWEFAKRLVAVGRKLNISNLLIGGDLFDMTNFSIYVQVVEPPGWATERAAARGFISYLLTWFTEIKIIVGNHDRRMQKFTAGAFDVSDILSLLTTNERVRMSNYGYCVIDTDSGPWRVTHPRNYSVNRLTVAGELALKYNQHIVSLHEHHSAMGWDRYGRRMIFNAGCLVDPVKLAYVMLDDSKLAGMQRGFMALKNGVPHLFGQYPMTDWSDYDGLA